MRTSESVKEITGALIKSVPEIKNLFPSAKGFGYDYIPLEDIVDELKPKLAKHGLVVIQMPISNDGSAEEGSIIKVGVETRLLHESGEWIEQAVYAPLTDLKKGTNTQKLGATITYLRRYGLACIFGITADVDVDGQLTDEKPKINEQLTAKAKAFKSLARDIESRLDTLDRTNVANLLKAIEENKADHKRIENALNHLIKKYK